MKNCCKLLVVLFLVAFTTSVWSATLSNNRHVFVKMADGAKFAHEDDDQYNQGLDTEINSYYIKADGGGLNQLHITTTLDNLYGQDTSTSAQSGSFYITTTGGRGYNDSVILMISVKGTIDDNFSVNIKSSGYEWSTPGSYPGTHSTSVINKTFTKSDFTTYGYSSHVYKPGPGELGVWSLPLFYGQTDFTTNETILFIDLKVGNVYNADLTEKGAAKVEYSFSNMNTSASFNAYAWCHDSNQLQGINWTQQTGATGSSSYTVNY